MRRTWILATLGALLAGTALGATTANRVQAAWQTKHQRYSVDDGFGSTDFDVFDATDRLVGSFFSDEDTGGADIYGSTSENRNVGFILGASEGETYLQMADASGNVRISMGVDATGECYLYMYDSRGRARFKKRLR